MTRPRLPSYLKGVSDTRRSLGDGTLEGRVRSATPYQLRSLRGVGRSVPAATIGALVEHHWLSMSAEEPREVPESGLLVPWTQEHWRRGFASPALGEPAITLSLTGNHVVSPSFRWGRLPESAGGGPVYGGPFLVEVLVNGIVVAPTIDGDPEWQARLGSAFAGDTSFYANRGDVVTVRVTPSGGPQWMRDAVFNITSYGTRGSVVAPLPPEFPGVPNCANFTEPDAEDQWQLESLGSPVADDGIGESEESVDGGWLYRMGLPISSHVIRIWEAQGSPSDGDINMVALVDSGPSNARGGVTLWRSGTDYYAVSHRRTLGEIQIWRNSVSVAQAAGPAGLQWTYVEADRTGNTIRARAWNPAGDQPDTWAVEWTDPSPHTGPGQIGIFGRNGNNIFPRRTWYDRVCFATGGDTVDV